jgi:LmbE family N-acetylglucosaminyl deacetylase
MAKLVRQGHDVSIAIIAEGITSRSENRDIADYSQVADLRSQATKAAHLLGVMDISFFGLPDNRLDTIPLLDIVKVVERLIEKLQPDRIYTHHPGDLNFDHTLVNRAVMIATRPMKGSPIREVYEFEVASSTEWAFQQFESPFCPNAFVDVSETLELKFHAMACYKTENRSFPHPRSLEALEAMAKRWGAAAGLEAAEAFQLVRAIS